MSHTIDQHARPVIFGELLFDHYPDGNKVLAGAPLAVAWHCQGFGLRPLLITRIGQDTEGELALAAMREWGIDTCGVQIDPIHATGKVQVTNKNDDNHFEIEPDQAWDHISSYLALEWVKTLPCSILYAGTLAQRSHHSHKTLQRLMLEVSLPVFVDINIREPWNDPEIVEQSLNEAHWLKLSDTDLTSLVASTQILTEKAKQLRSDYGIEVVYLTHGETGADVITEDEQISEKNKKIKVLDTVGAGDAFTAVCILGLHKQWTQQQILSRANEFAARICQQQGATTLTKQDYTDYLKKWI